MGRPRKEQSEGNDSSTTVPVTQPVSEMGEVMTLLKGVADGMTSIHARMDEFDAKINDIETGGANKFKKDAKAEDIAFASERRKGIDPKINAIVDEMLGEDFGAEVNPLGDRPGFRFTIVVPSRLTDNVMDKRPVMIMNAEGFPTQEYKKDERGLVIYEDYMPEDRRSRILSSSDSYEAVKAHCEKVRGNIVATYQKMARPLPEFKVK